MSFPPLKCILIQNTRMFTEIHEYLDTNQHLINYINERLESRAKNVNEETK